MPNANSKKCLARIPSGHLCQRYAMLSGNYCYSHSLSIKKQTPAKKAAKKTAKKTAKVNPSQAIKLNISKNSELQTQEPNIEPIENAYHDIFDIYSVGNLNETNYFLTNEANEANEANEVNEDKATESKCCFCGEACNPCSQSCGRCMRNILF